LLGLLLVAIGVSVWVIAIVELTSNEVMLNQDLSIEDVWRYEGALQWWENAYLTTIIPAIGLLVVSGIILMLGPRLLNY
jgi:hypothetical protein